MTLNEIWQMSYDEYVQYLLKKYGPATKDYYYVNRKGNLSKNKVTRTSEGLECHHIDEDKYMLLSKEPEARAHPETQTKDRLVYADRLEHIILHIKIAEMETAGSYGCGTRYLIGSVNKIFENPPQNGWEVNMYNKIADYFDVYIELLYRISDRFNRTDKILDILKENTDNIDEKTARVLTIIFAKDVNDRNMETPIKVMRAYLNHNRQSDYDFE